MTHGLATSLLQQYYCNEYNNTLTVTFENYLSKIIKDHSLFEGGSKTLIKL